MKKRITLIIAAVLVFCLLAVGCSAKEEPAVTEAPASATPAPTPEPTPEPCVIMGVTYPLDTESIDLRGLNDTLVDETAAQLKRLTKLKTITLGSWEESPVTWGKMNELHSACPRAAIDYEFTIYGKTFNLSDEEMDLKYVSIKDEGKLLKLITHCMTNLTFLDMDTAGVSDEKMAELRDSLPNTEVVWRIWFGDYYSVRTNVERILASMPGKAGELTTESTRSLKYCTKVKYMDLGHNNFLDTIDFVSYMPDLEVLIVGMTFVEDFYPLEDCPKLEYLEAMTSRLHDLRPLANLKNLKHLNICYNFAVTDITPLYGLTQLERLWIGKYDPVPPEQIEKIKELLPNCVVNSTVGDPTNGGWRMDPEPNEFGVAQQAARYALLRDQFGYHEEDFSYYWNDRLCIRPY